MHQDCHFAQATETLCVRNIRDVDSKAINMQLNFQNFHKSFKFLFVKLEKKRTVINPVFWSHFNKSKWWTCVQQMLHWGKTLEIMPIFSELYINFTLCFCMLLKTSFPSEFILHCVQERCLCNLFLQVMQKSFLQYSVKFISYWGNFFWYNCFS